MSRHFPPPLRGPLVRARVLMAALLTATLAVPAVVRGATPLPLVNPSFESNWSGWTQSYGTTGVSFDTSVKADGAKSLKIVDTTANAVGVENSVAVDVGGKHIEATAKLLVKTGQASVYLRFYSESNQLLLSEIKDAGASPNWTTLSLAAVAPAGTKRVNVLLYTGASNTGEVNFDAVTLTTPVFESLGAQIKNREITYAAFGKNENGQNVMFAGSNGSPAKLALYPLTGGKPLHTFELPGASTIWAVTVASDNSVYIGTYPGKLFRYVPSERKLIDLGVVLKQTMVWDITAGKDGRIFGGTYPDGKVFTFKPGEAVEEILGGQVNPGVANVRSIAYDSVDDQLYLGLGTPAYLIKSNLAGTIKTDILPAKFKPDSYVYYTNYAGGKIFAYLHDQARTVVLDKNNPSGTEDAVLAGISSTGVSGLSPVDDKVYYTKSGILFCYDLSDKKETDLGWHGPARGFGFVVENNVPYLVAGLMEGHLLKYNLTTNKGERIPFERVETDVEIRAVSGGPHGQIYTSGFVQGAIGVYHRSGFQAATEQKKPDQVENFTFAGNTLYAGVYPHAVIESFEVAAAGTTVTNRLQLANNLEGYGQDRPFGMLAVPTVKKLFVGSVPTSDKVGGAFAIYPIDGAAGTPAVHHNLIPNHSIVALAYKDNKVYGGTSVFGGVSIKPVATEARLFVWDAVKGGLLYNEVPVAGKRAITELVNGPDGNIWGLAEGTLFIFDPVGKTVVYRQNLFSHVDYATWTAGAWSDGKIVMGQNGYVYVGIGGKLFRMHPDTKQVQLMVDDGVKSLARDDVGNLYYAKLGQLIKVGM